MESMEEKSVPHEDSPTAGNQTKPVAFASPLSETTRRKILRRISWLEEQIHEIDQALSNFGNFLNDELRGREYGVVQSRIGPQEMRSMLHGYRKTLS